MNPASDLCGRLRQPRHRKKEQSAPSAKYRAKRRARPVAGKDRRLGAHGLTRPPRKIPTPTQTWEPDAPGCASTRPSSWVRLDQADGIARRVNGQVGARFSRRPGRSPSFALVRTPAGTGREDPRRAAGRCRLRVDERLEVRPKAGRGFGSWGSHLFLTPKASANPNYAGGTSAAWSDPVRPVSGYDRRGRVRCTT